MIGEQREIILSVRDREMPSQSWIDAFVCALLSIWRAVCFFVGEEDFLMNFSVLLFAWGDVVGIVYVEFVEEELRLDRMGE